MTDAGRKDLSDKMQEKVTPESSKSTTDKVKEGVTDTTDKVTRDVMPDSQKSGGQSTADKAGREKDHAEAKGDSFMDKAKHAVGLDKH